MTVISPDPGLRQTALLVAAARNWSAQQELSSRARTDLVLYDARQSPPEGDFFGRLDPGCRVVYLVRPGSLLGALHLYESAHTVEIFWHAGALSESQLDRRLSHCLAHSAPMTGCPPAFASERAQVSGFQEKARVIHEIEGYAKQSGVGASLRDRIRLVADELMMNALYHAPGRTTDAPRALARQSDLHAIFVQYGCSSEAFGLCVRDDFGTLERVRALHYLRRSASAKSEIEDKQSGAGLGLSVVLNSSSEFTLTLRAGASTEAFALFDKRRSKCSHREPNSLRILATSRVSKKAVRCHAPQR